MNLENTKIYTTDPEVIRKYAELCGKKFECAITSSIGVYNCDTYKKINYFMMGSPVDIDNDFKQLATDQINAMHDEKFGKVETPEEAEAFDIMAQANHQLKNYDVSVLRPVIDVDGKLYTADDVRALFSLQDTKAEWNGEGLPPVGVECWFNWINQSPEVCTPTYFGNGVGCYIDKRGNEYTMALNTVSFSRIETKQQREERERLEAIDEMSKIVEMKNGSAGNAYKKYCTALYDAGYRKQKDGE